MPKTNKITVNVNDIFTVQRNAIFSLVFLTNTLRKQPIPNRKINVHWLELVAIEPQSLLIQTVLKMVELDEPAVSEGYANVLSAKIPETRQSDRIV